MRLSQENENRQRTSNHQSSSLVGTQEIVSLKRQFPKSRRLKTRDEFRRIKKYGKRITGRAVIFDVLSEKFPFRRLGLTVSKRFGNALSRNRFKRLIREAFRLTQYQLPPGLILHVTPRPDTPMPTFKEILEDFALLL
ncbi:MAG: ribonuclease P protein component [Verrucomicrobia bacterium]|nr:ribonuclease P protein component [Verrucomicrobiota bacterium]